MKTLHLEYAIPQARIIYQEGQIKVLYGGRGGAKSWSFVMGIVDFMMQYKIRVVICRDTLKSIKRSVQQLLQDTVDRLGVSEHFEMVGEEFRCKTTGATCFWMGLSDNLGQIKSLEGVDICFVEEAAYVQEEAWDLLIPTLRKPGVELWISFNPRYETDWVSSVFLLADELPPGTIVERVYYWDNSKLSEKSRQDAEFCKRTDPEKYEHDWLGEHSRQGESMQFMDAGLLTDAQERVIKQHEHYKKIAGLDIAAEGKDKTCLIIRQGPKILFKKKWHRADHGELARELIPYLMGCDALYVDYTSWGYGLSKQLLKIAPCPVHFVNGGDPPGAEGYKNRRAELWGRAKSWLGWGNLPVDADLMRALLTPQYWFTDGGLLQLEGKIRIKKRGLESPDDGDALAYSMCDDYEERTAELAPRPKPKHKPKMSRGWMSR